MPIARNYNGGSIVYFQGDVGDEVYILQKGRVALIATALDTGEEIKEEVKLGEFFGVKSALTRLGREETAQVMGKTSLIVFKVPEFEQFVMKNTRLIMKMLRVFSRQLREIHRQVRDILKAGAAKNPASELLNVAESFYKNGAIEHCVYAFSRYLEYNPNGRNVKRAQDLLQMARKGMIYPPNMAPPEPEDSDAEPDEVRTRTLESGMRLADQALDDPFAFDGGPAPAAKVERSLHTIYEKAQAAAMDGRHDDALSAYEECLGFSNLRNSDEQDVFAQAHYERGVELLALERHADASAAFSLYLKKFPTGESVKSSIFQLGAVAEAQGNSERARTLFHKVATMPPPDDVSMEARKRIEALH
ncbi:MAG: cyclic nucleotide-binding domain-containing protein [Leptospirales bacterium]|nr:cyclic nucleotide-binding domain-containing protein [Leptospirales bacterium]